MYNFLNTVNDSIFILYKYFYSNVSLIVLLCLRQKNKEKKFYKKILERIIVSSPVFRIEIFWVIIPSAMTTTVASVNAFGARRCRACSHYAKTAFFLDKSQGADFSIVYYFQDMYIIVKNVTRDIITKMGINVKQKQMKKLKLTYQKN